MKKLLILALLFGFVNLNISKEVEWSDVPPPSREFESTDFLYDDDMYKPEKDNALNKAIDLDNAVEKNSGTISTQNNVVAPVKVAEVKPSKPNKSEPPKRLEGYTVEPPSIKIGHKEYIAVPVEAEKKEMGWIDVAELFFSVSFGLLCLAAVVWAGLKIYDEWPWRKKNEIKNPLKEEKDLNVDKTK